MVSGSLVFYELRCTETALLGHPTTGQVQGCGGCLLKVSNGVRRTAFWVVASLVLGLTVLGLSSRDLAQAPAPAQPAPSPATPTQTQKDQGIPDAPSAVQPPAPAPENPLPTPGNAGQQPAPMPIRKPGPSARQCAAGHQSVHAPADQHPHRARRRSDQGSVRRSRETVYHHQEREPGHGSGDGEG